MAEILPMRPVVKGRETTWNQLIEIDEILDRIAALTTSVVKQSETLREGSLPTDLDLHRRTLHFEARLESMKLCVEDARQVLGQMKVLT